eukprot:TRINITY_DN29448_c0_g1_i10.p2 TRINITY_DN29448_c0_g1~~TRINITY_DN29448_c0_g1_i10.p2  ORF type:complete len:199 (+),score=-9.68 TRINITY_DN29448_c0_g1_i10:52-648(+)
MFDFKFDFQVLGKRNFAKNFVGSSLNLTSRMIDRLIWFQWIKLFEVLESVYVCIQPGVYEFLIIFVKVLFFIFPLCFSFFSSSYFCYFGRGRIDKWCRFFLLFSSEVFIFYNFDKCPKIILLYRKKYQISHTYINQYYFTDFNYQFRLSDPSQQIYCYFLSSYFFVFQFIGELSVKYFVKNIIFNYILILEIFLYFMT